MINIAFLSGLAALLFAALIWGIKTLPSERWQMIAAVVPTKKLILAELIALSAVVAIGSGDAPGLSFLAPHSS